MIDALANETITINSPFLNALAQIIIPPLKILYFLVGGLIGVYVITLILRFLSYKNTTRSMKKMRIQLKTMQETLEILKKDIKEIKKQFKTDTIKSKKNK